MMSLASSSRGWAVCLHVEGDGPEVTRLKRMGVCTGRRLEVVQTGDPMILSVAGTRIGLSRQLAGVVFVEPLTVENANGQNQLSESASGN